MIREIIEALRPKLVHPDLRRVLDYILHGGQNSLAADFRHENADVSLRRWTREIFRTLRSVFPTLTSPIDAIVTRHKQSIGGTYSGIVYEPTDLGRLVYKQLKIEHLL